MLLRCEFRPALREIEPRQELFIPAAWRQFLPVERFHDSASSGRGIVRGLIEGGHGILSRRGVVRGGPEARPQIRRALSNLLFGLSGEHGALAPRTRALRGHIRDVLVLLIIKRVSRRALDASQRLLKQV